MKPELRVAVRRTAHTEALMDGRVESPRVALRFIPVEPISRAFRRAIRDQEFDISEMALATLAMAHDNGCLWKGLAIRLMGGPQHGALRVRPDSPIQSPADLPGRRIGVRAYSQTTAVWLRGILETEYGIAPGLTQWVTTEDAHVPGFVDPPYAVRAAEGVGVGELFERDEIDAAIGDNATRLEGSRSVIPEPEDAAKDWSARTGIHPVNHVLAFRPGLVEEYPWMAAEILRIFRVSGVPECDRVSLEAGLGFVFSQGLVSQPCGVADLFVA